jgi:hypothetical protein
MNFVWNNKPSSARTNGKGTDIRILRGRYTGMSYTQAYPGNPNKVNGSVDGRGQLRQAGVETQFGPVLPHFAKQVFIIFAKFPYPSRLACVIFQRILFTALFALMRG